MIRHTEFHSSAGITEGFISGSVEPGVNFYAEAESLLREYQSFLNSMAINAAGTLLLRFHLSDPINQVPQLQPLIEDLDLPVSIVGQPPADGSRIALESWIWHRSPRNYEARFFSLPVAVPGNSYEQTAAEFAAVEKEVRSCGGSVAANVQRTWLYCRDVDNDYTGLVKARNDFFNTCGLRTDTHFITSTGIGGETDDPARRIKMDSLLWFGLSEGQVDYLTAPAHLSPTALYGVSFERGSRIAFRDRSHFYISGTASIDRHGKVLYQNDVRAQTVRMLENFSALLESGGASLHDLRQAVVYLRDGADAAIVREELYRSGIRETMPLTMTVGRVCRPAWLVEMEGIAISGSGDDRFLPLA